jgi:hypothetical protein
MALSDDTPPEVRAEVLMWFVEMMSGIGTKTRKKI